MRCRAAGREPSRRAATLLGLFVALSGAGCSDRAARDELGGAHFAVIGLRTVTLIDSTRSTMPNGSFPGAATRTLPTDLWYPAPADTAETGEEIPCLGGLDDRIDQPASSCRFARDLPLDPGESRYPLIVLSHGFGNGRDAVRLFGRALAQNGYVVAAPDFPLSNRDAPGGPNLTDLPGQAGDVSFVADVLLGYVADNPPPFPDRIDPNRLGTGGRSLGGATTLLVTHHSRFRDPRFRASAPVSPAYVIAAALVGVEGFFDGISTPLLIIGGSDDTQTPFGDNQQVPYDLAEPPKVLLELFGEGHSPVNQATSRGLVSFFRATLNGRSADLAVFDHFPGARVERAG